MKRFALLAACAAVLVGCGSGSAEDEALKTAAPPAGPDAQEVQPNLNKNMPTQGGPSGMDSQPMVAPGKG